MDAISRQEVAVTLKNLGSSSRSSRDRGGELTNHSDGWELVEGSEGSGSSSELIFPRASASDAGSYRCVARSEAGSFLAEVFAIMERKLS
ncbi:hypothetical protein E2C01_068552 [Portunus trituberculatus]|uniref:Ig-like domain-containing protein n=1 Tax=Portunus trituberculatus TaxID=210409 RepID=A0A5B7HP45_PORTR|nr:hypothetical protein [Portunus trituberculatus]